MEHLALEIFDLTGDGSRFANLPKDTVITITDTSEVFDEGNVWSHQFTLNTVANAHIFGTSGDLHGSRLHSQLDKRRARLWVEGLPLYLGYLRLNSEADVDEDGNVNVTFESGQKTLADMLDGMNARDVPMLGNHLLGVAAWRDRSFDLTVWCKLLIDSSNPALSSPFSFQIGTEDGTMSTRLPKYVLHSGNFKKADQSAYTVAYNDTINTDSPYDDNSPMSHPYCNVDVGYQKKSADGEVVREYTIHQVAYKTSAGQVNKKAWPNTAPCFYVMYWLRALLTHLGIHIDENQMQDVEDLRRLFMFNTLCAYDEPEEAPTAGGTGKNLLLTGGEFYGGVASTYDLGESGAVITKATVTPKDGSSPRTGSKNDYTVAVTNVQKADETVVWHPAYASSDCFPNVEASAIITALRDAFGIRLLFSNDYRRVRVVLLRNIFRSQDVVEMGGEVLRQTKTENNIRGFMMTYGSDDTAFKLPIFDRMLSKKHETDTTAKDYVLTPAEYGDITKAVSGFNKHLYYTDDGNTYAVKVDKDAKRYRELFPSLHEVAGFMDAVDGDCTGDDDTFVQVSLGFTPLIVNDANTKRGRPDTDEQKFFVFVDEDMNASSYPVKTDGTTEVNGDISCGKVTFQYETQTATHNVEAEMYVYETNEYHMHDNYEQNDDGVAPIETHDWGLTLGVMRGSGDDAYVNYTPDADDHEGNDTWEVMPGDSATAHSDTCNDYGKEWDYNGSSHTVIDTAAEAEAELQTLFPDSNAAFFESGFDKGYITGAGIVTGIPDETGKLHSFLIATKRGSYSIDFGQDYIPSWTWHSVSDILEMDAADKCIIVEVDSCNERLNTLLDLCHRAYEPNASEVIRIDNGIGSRYGRFSLKLRAEKPNPYYDPDSSDSDEQDQFLEISNPNLRGRGLADQFYKEYSHWIRNARTTSMRKTLGIAQLLSIDKTVRHHIGDVTGFIKQMQFSVSLQDGLGPVDMDILYI